MLIADNNKELVEDRTISYKLRLVVDVNGEVNCQLPLAVDTGIYTFMQWTIEDIESKLKGTCDIVDVKRVELEDVSDDSS